MAAKKLTRAIGRKAARGIGPVPGFRAPGKRKKITKWVHGRRCVVSIEVEAVIPAADPKEASLEPATVLWLDEIQRLADVGDVNALLRIGEVYVRRRSA